MSILTGTHRTIRLTLPKLSRCYHLNGNCYRRDEVKLENRRKLGSVKRGYTELIQPQRQEEEEEETTNIEVFGLTREETITQLKVVTNLVLKGRLNSGWRKLKGLVSTTLSVEELELVVGYRLSQVTTPEKVGQWLRYSRRERGEELAGGEVDWSELNYQVKSGLPGSELLRWAVPEKTYQWLTAGEGRDRAWCNPLHCILLSYQHQLSYYRHHQFQGETYDFTRQVPDHPTSLALSLFDILKLVIKSTTGQLNLGQFLFVIHSLKAASVAIGKLSLLLEGTRFLKELQTKVPPRHPLLYLPLMEGFTTFPLDKTPYYYSGRLRFCLELRHLMVQTQTTFHDGHQLLPLLETCFPPEHPPLPLLQFRIPTPHGNFLRGYRAGVYVRLVERERRRDQLSLTPEYFEYLLALESLNPTPSTPFPTRWQRLHDTHQFPVSQGAYRLLFGYRRDEPAYLQGFRDGVEALELAIRTNFIPKRTLHPSLITGLIEAAVFYQDPNYYRRVLLLLVMKVGLPTLPTIDLCHLALHVPVSLPLPLLSTLEDCLVNHQLDTAVGPFALLTFYARSYQPTKVHRLFLAYLQFHRSVLPFTYQLTEEEPPTLTLIPLVPATDPPHPVDPLTTALVSEVILTYLHHYHHPVAALHLLHSFLPFLTPSPLTPPPYFPHRTLHALRPYTSSFLPLTPLTTVDLTPLLPFLTAFRSFHYPPHPQ